MRPHVIAQVRVAPGERIELESGAASGVISPARSAVALVNRLSGPEFRDDPPTGKSTLGRRRRRKRSGVLRSGGQILILTNPHSRELVIRVERTATRNDALTAAQAASMSLFRELFPGELLAPGQLATVSMVTLLVTALDPQQADSLYNELGDARAFSVIHEHLQHLGDAIRAGGGAVVKTMGEGVLASFNEVEEAVRTAIDLVPRPGSGGGTAQARRAGRHSPGHDPGRHA